MISSVGSEHYLITIVDTDGNVKEKVKETTEVVSMLDEKDLGLMQDMNEIIWGDKH